MIFNISLLRNKYLILTFETEKNILNVKFLPSMIFQ